MWSLPKASICLPRYLFSVYTSQPYYAWNTEHEGPGGSKLHSSALVIATYITWRELDILYPVCRVSAWRYPPLLRITLRYVILCHDHNVLATRTDRSTKSPNTWTFTWCRKDYMNCSPPSPLPLLPQTQTWTWLRITHLICYFFWYCPSSPSLYRVCWVVCEVVWVCSLALSGELEENWDAERFRLQA